jgi:hypothetical protein
MHRPDSGALSFRAWNPQQANGLLGCSPAAGTVIDAASTSSRCPYQVCSQTATSAWRGARIRAVKVWEGGAGARMANCAATGPAGRRSRRGTPLGCVLAVVAGVMAVLGVEGGVGAWRVQPTVPASSRPITSQIAAIPRGYLLISCSMTNSPDVRHRE